MEKIYLTRLRDKKTSMADFRVVADKLSHVLAQRTFEHINLKKVSVQTPLTETEGAEVAHQIVLIPILRSGLAFLPAFLYYFSQADVGFVGLKRNEDTAIAYEYYRNLPEIKKDATVILIDPMFATGGSAMKAIEIIKSLGVPEEHILFASMIAAPEGIELVEKNFPKVKRIILQTDDHLDAKKFIVPGIGDFGDRYFGTEVVGGQD
jgi:uracil phosphoribosyltransferase